RGAFGLLAHPLRGGALRPLLRGAGARPPAAAHPARLFAPRRGLHAVLGVLRPGEGHHGAHRDAHPGAVRGPDHRREGVGAGAPGLGAAVADVAVPAAVPGGAGGLALPVRVGGLAVHRRRPGDVTGRRRGVPALDVANERVAVRGLLVKSADLLLETVTGGRILTMGSVRGGEVWSGIAQRGQLEGPTMLSPELARRELPY